MTAVLKRLDPTRVELEIDIPDEEMDVARDRAFRTLVRNTRIPGFRPGKAPRRIFEQQFGTMGIEERALDEVIPKVYTQALDEHALHPIERPQMELLPRESSGPIRFKITVDVRPEIELANLEEQKLDVMPPVPSEEEITKALEAMRRDGATLSLVERAAQIGDTVIADYLGSIEGEPFPGGTAEGQQVDLIEDRFIPGFASGIAGMSAGEEKDVEAIFPADYAETSLAGKTAVFHVKVHEVKEPELPALDDEFAGRYLPAPATLERLREELIARVSASMRSQFRNEQAETFLERLLTLHEFALPEVMVERELEAAIQQNRFDAGKAEETLDKETETTLKLELRPEAEKRVKTLLLIEAIARKEKIQATNAEVEHEIAELAQRYGMPRERMREAIKDQLHGLVDGIIRKKTLDLLLDRAIPSEASATKSAEE